MKTLADAWAEGYGHAMMLGAAEYGHKCSELDVADAMRDAEENPYLDPKHTQLEAARQNVIDRVKTWQAGRGLIVGEERKLRDLLAAARLLTELETP